MAGQNAEILTTMLKEVQERPEALYEVLDEEVEWDTSELRIPTRASSGRGPETVRAFFRSWVGAFDEWGFEVEEVIEGEDTVIVRIHQWGQGRSSGVEVENRFWQVWTMRDGKAVRATHHKERDEALAAAGISE